MLCYLVVLGLLSFNNADQVIQLTKDNIDGILKQNELVFINFYADWCRFSNMLAPIFAEGSDKISERYPANTGKAVFGKVDCDKEVELAQLYKITKYPTLKLVRFGEVMKKEYRGQRSAEAFLKYIDDNLVNPIKTISSHEEMEGISDNNRNMLAYVADENSKNYKNLLKAASQLRTECQWYVMAGPSAVPFQKDGEDVIYFRQPFKQGSDLPFTGLTSVDSLTNWAKDLCVPRVRVLTFENAEELTEEGLPFLILFHHPDDHETPNHFLEQVNLQLANDKDTINALTADGLKFAHPLQHLGKGNNDLPLIAIDSFKHMYLWKHDVRTQLGVDGLLKSFVDDLNNGRLHREFHYGPDQVVEQPAAAQPAAGHDHGHHQQKREAEQPSPTQQEPAEKTSPPPSIFNRLKPSYNRYTILKDEL